MKQIFDTKWFTCDFDTIGIVLMENEIGEQRAYIRNCPGNDPESDTQYIADHGAKLTLPQAMGFFPELDPDKYKQG